MEIFDIIKLMFTPIVTIVVIFVGMYYQQKTLLKAMEDSKKKMEKHNDKIQGLELKVVKLEVDHSGGMSHLEDKIDMLKDMITIMDRRLAVHNDIS